MRFEFPWVLEHTKDVTDFQWLIVTGIGFLLVALLMARFVWPSMVKPYLVNRDQGIRQAAEQVETTLRETASLRNDYRRRLEQIHDETRQRMEEAVHEADNLRTTILAEAQQNAEALVRRGNDEVERERAKAMARLRTQFIQGVIGAANDAASRSLDDSHQRRLIDAFINDLGVKS